MATKSDIAERMKAIPRSEVARGFRWKVDLGWGFFFFFVDVTSVRVEQNTREERKRRVSYEAQ